MRAERAGTLFVAILLNLGSGCGGGATTTACNGHDALCTRAYDRVAFAGTHDAYSNIANNFGAPDQNYTMTRQLADGVRVLHLEIFSDAGDVSLCHAVCAVGSQLLVDGLLEVSAFVEAHPREVVTLLMESSGVSTDAVAAALDRANLTRRLHVQRRGAPWPTLGALIAGGDRVVAFLDDKTNSGGGAHPQLLPRWQWTWETPWNNSTPSDFARCNADRGTAGNSLYVVDTYLEDLVIPTAKQAAWVNVDPFLIERLWHCRAAAGQLPNFVMVNYYDVGDLFAAVDALNGFAPAPAGDADAFVPTWQDAAAPRDGGARD